MAFYHVGGCSCPIGCCDCGVTNQDREEDALVKEMHKILDPLEFTALYKDLCGDKRKNAIYPADYRIENSYRRSGWAKAFIRFVNEPDQLKVIEAGHMLHDKFKDSEFYKPKLLKRALWSLIHSGGFTDKEQQEIDQYFADLFSYEVIQTEWK